MFTIKVPVQQLLPYNALQSQLDFKQSSIEKNPPILCQLNEMNNRLKTTLVDIHMDSSSSVITRGNSSLEQNTTASENTNLGYCDVEGPSNGISACSVNQQSHENLNLAIGCTTPAVVGGTIVS